MDALERSKVRGARDMLRECAKQLRGVNATDHATLADMHANELGDFCGADAQAAPETAKHTPGDWKHVGESGSRRYIMAGNLQLARVHDTWAKIDNGARAAESYANGDLFAAAPDLLAACKELLCVFVEGGTRWERLDAIRHTNAAIAKTTPAC